MNYISAFADSNQERLSWDEYFMSVSFLISTRSPCERLRAGCVLVKDKRIISTGYNGFLPGMPHNSVIYDGHEQATVHAEENAIADCASRGVCVRGATAYVTHYPCLNSAKILATSGIKELRFAREYRNDTLVEEITNLNIIRING
jgi:dCMP deaminase